MNDQQWFNEEEHSTSEAPQMSRAAYRQQLQQQVDEQSEVDSEEVISGDPEHVGEKLSRESTASERKQATATAKTLQLKKRLNIAIAILIVAIIIVYLVLFLVK